MSTCRMERESIRLVASRRCTAMGAFRGHPLGAGAALNKKTPAHYLVLWAIMADERLSAAAKCVATVLLLQFRNHKTSVCNPSFTTIAHCVGRRRRSVIDAINELRELGWMDWEGTAGGRPTNTNNFQFFLKPRPVQQTANYRAANAERAR